MKKNNLKTIIITCWAVLVLCFIIKLFGGNWFELGAENIKFIQFCNFVDNNMWLKMLLSCIIYCISTYYVVCISANVKHLTIKQIAILLPIMIAKSILSWWFYWIAFVLDIIVLLIYPAIISKKFIRSVICFGVVLAFQVISLVIRNIGINNFNENSFLLMFIMQIDYYIMIILFYLHNIQRKEK